MESSSTSRSPSQITGARTSRSSFPRPLLSLVGSWQNISFCTHRLGMWQAASQGLLLVSGLTSLGHSISASLAAGRHAAKVMLLVRVTQAVFRKASPTKIRPSCSMSAGLPASGRTGPTGPSPAVSCPCMGIRTCVKWLYPGAGSSCT